MVRGRERGSGFATEAKRKPVHKGSDQHLNGRGLLRCLAVKLFYLAVRKSVMTACKIRN